MYVYIYIYTNDFSGLWVRVVWKLLAREEIVKIIKLIMAYY